MGLRREARTIASRGIDPVIREIEDGGGNTRAPVLGNLA